MTLSQYDFIFPDYGKWCVAKYGDPYLEFVLCIWPIQVHTHSSEHTPGAVGSQCCGARGAVGGSVPCSRVSPQSWYWRWRERCSFTPPTYNPCRTWDSNPRPSGYKSNSLSISLGPKLQLFITITALYLSLWHYISQLRLFHYCKFISPNCNFVFHNCVFIARIHNFCSHSCI